MTTIQKPEATEYAPFFATYINKVAGDNLLELLSTSYIETMELVTSLDAETLHYRYAEGKWNILEIIQHIIDTERIFTYRALRIARHDKTPLPGFNENEFVAHCNASTRNINDLVREFSLVRASTIELFKSFTPEMLAQKGISNNNELSVRAIAYITLGHELHHRSVIEERYIN
jgi:hypothetical protein